MRGAAPLYDAMYNAFWVHEEETAASCVIVLTALGSTPVIHELHYGYDADPTAEGPSISIRDWAGNTWYWGFPVTSKGPYVWEFPGGIWVPPEGNLGKIYLTSGGDGIIGRLSAMLT